VLWQTDGKQFKNFDRGKSQEYRAIFQDFPTEKVFKMRRQVFVRTPRI